MQKKTLKESKTKSLEKFPKEIFKLILKASLKGRHFRRNFIGEFQEQSLWQLLNNFFKKILGGIPEKIIGDDSKRIPGGVSKGQCGEILEV